MWLERSFDHYIEFNKQKGNKIGISLLRSHKALFISLIEAEIIKEPSAFVDRIADSLKSTSSETRVGSIVQQLRLKQRKSVRQVAREAGISPNHLWRIERLLSSPTEGLIRKLAVAFDVPVSFLFGETPSISNPTDPDNSEVI